MRRPAALLVLLIGLVAATVAPAATKPRRRPPQRTRVELARYAIRLATDARSNEEIGGYALAADQLRKLRGFAPVDPDLDLALALDLARSGERDSAAALLYGRILSIAIGDTAYRPNFDIYGWRHEKTYFGGRFDGWYWYVARARAEVEAARGHWAEARDAARTCTRARPLAGSEWYLYALCAARDGAADEARPAIERALRLAPTLPEAQYLSGLLAWRDGRRMAAQQAFRTAIDLDSTYREPAVALARSRLPVPPDSLPRRLLTGAREAALLTSPARPKFDEFIQLDQPARVTHRVDITIPDSLSERIKPIVINPLVLFDRRGHAVFQQDPWAAATSAPEAFVGMVSQATRGWTIAPPTKNGRPQAIWLQLDIHATRATPQGE